MLENEFIASLIEETDSEFKASNTAKAWKVVNTITNRKNMPSGELKGKSPRPTSITQAWRFGQNRKLQGNSAHFPYNEDHQPNDIGSIHSYAATKVAFAQAEAQSPKFLH